MSEQPSDQTIEDADELHRNPRLVGGGSDGVSRSPKAVAVVRPGSRRRTGAAGFGLNVKRISVRVDRLGALGLERLEIDLGGGTLRLALLLALAHGSISLRDRPRR